MEERLSTVQRLHTRRSRFAVVFGVVSRALLLAVVFCQRASLLFCRVVGAAGLVPCAHMLK